MIRQGCKQGKKKIEVESKKKGWVVGIFLLLFPFLQPLVYAQTSDNILPNRCVTSQNERIKLQLNPNRRKAFGDLNRRIEQYLTDGSGLRKAADTVIYRIPVVVHVIHSTASGQIGGQNNGNVSDELIFSQIQILNEDYRRKVGTPGENSSSISADAGIEFYLATTDPDGQPTTGITRNYYSTKSSFDVLNFSDISLLSQIIYWPTDRYLNIWVTTISNNNLGYTPQYPTITASDTLQGLPLSVDEPTDGIIVDYRVFGNQTTSSYYSTYALGRTATHEVGHWLGLFHPDGPYGDPCGDDYVADTPLTDDLNQTTSCNDIYSYCSGVRTRELTENYMMYSPDQCMNMFTAGQVARMRAVMAVSPRRNSLLSDSSALVETENLTIKVYPNPTSSDPFVDIQLKGQQDFSIDLFDATGRQLHSVTYSETSSTRVSVSLKGLSSGIYIVRVKTNNEAVSKRLLVQ